MNLNNTPGHYRIITRDIKGVQWELYFSKKELYV